MNITAATAALSRELGQYNDVGTDVERKHGQLIELTLANIYSNFQMKDFSEVTRSQVRTKLAFNLGIDINWSMARNLKQFIDPIAKKLALEMFTARQQEEETSEDSLLVPEATTPKRLTLSPKPPVRAKSPPPKVTTKKPTPIARLSPRVSKRAPTLSASPAKKKAKASTTPVAMSRPVRKRSSTNLSSEMSSGASSKASPAHVAKKRAARRSGAAGRGSVVPDASMPGALTTLVLQNAPIIDETNLRNIAMENLGFNYMESSSRTQTAELTQILQVEYIYLISIKDLLMPLGKARAILIRAGCGLLPGHLLVKDLLKAYVRLLMIVVQACTNAGLNGKNNQIPTPDKIAKAIAEQSDEGTSSDDETE